MKLGKEAFPALTGIRALGAAAVFFVHCPFYLGYTLVIDVMAFFFVLSGFLIVYLYYTNEGITRGKVKNYFINRFARIYPVYFFLVTIAILLKHDFRPLFLFKNYTLTHALFYNQADRVIQQSWSITVEECFYVLAPLIMYLLRRFNFFVSLMFGAATLLVALIVSTLPISFLHTANFVFSITFFGHFFEFYCGIFLALMILKVQQQHQPLLQGKKFTLMGTTGILLCFAVLMASGNMNDPDKQIEYVLVNNFILPVPIAVLYYGLIREKSFTSKILSSKLLGIAGRTSYSFYLVHVLVIEYIALPYIEKYFNEQRNLYVLTVFFLTQVISLLIYIFLEDPMNRFIRNKCIKEKTTT